MTSETPKSSNVESAVESDFEQTADAPIKIDFAFRRLSDLAQNFEQGAFARAIATNNSNDIALFDIE
jgi:hypothetical protein